MVRADTSVCASYRLVLAAHAHDETEPLVKLNSVLTLYLCTTIMDRRICDNSPTMFIVVELFPIFPTLSVAVHVCTPLSRDLSMLSVILGEVEPDAKHDLHVDDHL